MAGTRGAPREAHDENAQKITRLEKETTEATRALDEARSEKDRRENELSLARGFRLFSVYRYDPRDPDARLWIITEADRRSTCVLLPADY